MRHVCSNDQVSGSRPLLTEKTTVVFVGFLAWAAAFGNTFFGGGEPQAVGFEWVKVTYDGGIDVDVAVLKPKDYSDSRNHPLILTLPWGRGTPALVLGMIDAYWDIEALERGYVVVSPAILGSSLETKADVFLPALFAWLDANVSYDSEQVVLAGASNGGRGVFHVLASDPLRFSAVIGMPGSYSGPVESIKPFAGRPTWLMVGESDSRWRMAAESTRLTLETAGISTRLDVLEGQGHVLSVDQRTIMNWIDEVLEGSRRD